MANTAKPKPAAIAPENEIKLVFVPCENAEDMLVDFLKYVLEIAAQQRQEAA